MKTHMQLAAILLSGTMFLGCDHKAKDQQDAAAQPSRPTMPPLPADTSAKASDATSKAGDMMKSAGDTLKQDTSKATDTAKQELNNVGNALKDDAQKLKDKANGTQTPPPPSVPQ